MQQATYASVSQPRRNEGGQQAHSNGHSPQTGSSKPEGNRHARERSPTHQPKTNIEDEQMYILTLLTDSNMHQNMTGLRKKYFPPKLNHLGGHVTLFHALPESKLESDIIPALKELALKTKKFELGATTPFKLKKGIAIGMPKDHGGSASRDVHTTLVRKWSDFLSQQDFGFQAHFTIMNKVDDEKEIDQAFHDVKDGWQPCFGTAEGLSLYRYSPKGWHWQNNFDFQDK
ncbi:Hypothetical protein D9617_3g019370 [Elsinoe fawcettii]|nr:Hypothetical protein D9617_3g019370 [Elsinoe fawcettii]